MLSGCRNRTKQSQDNRCFSSKAALSLCEHGRLLASAPMGVISERETRQIESAKASGRTPVVAIHGLWLLPSSWSDWAQLFEEAGYAALTPG
jgi:hypothetical protein